MKVDHKGETMGIKLENCLKGWGIAKIGCVTVDNASANSEVIAYLNRGVSVWNGQTLLIEEFMHMWCFTHILNLTVTDGLKEIDSSINKTKVICTFVMFSPSKLATFKKCAEEVSLMLCCVLMCQLHGLPTYLT